MISVVVPAHNEAKVLPRLLDALRPGIDAGVLSVVVVANGCDDDTAGVARSAGVEVVELGAGDKTRALNAGDAESNGFPRFYVDGDVVVSADDLEQMATRLVDGFEAVAPELRLDGQRSGWLLRSYHRYWAALPTVRHSLAGRGCFGLTEAGRSRWEGFPPVVADDQFVNQMFSANEIAIAAGVASTVTLPTSLGALVTRKRRSHRGNLELAEAGPSTATSRVRWIEVLRVEPRRAIDLPAFLVVTMLVRLGAWRDGRAGDPSWGADATSRAAS
jgi:glycosyltransferase involved in cell wall biosynthesis